LLEPWLTKTTNGARRRKTRVRYYFPLDPARHHQEEEEVDIDAARTTGVVHPRHRRKEVETSTTTMMLEEARDSWDCKIGYGCGVGPVWNACSPSCRDFASCPCWRRNLIVIVIRSSLLQTLLRESPYVSVLVLMRVQRAHARVCLIGQIVVVGRSTVRFDVVGKEGRRNGAGGSVAGCHRQSVSSKNNVNVSCRPHVLK
jgi:hypothetical protein